MSRHFTEVGPKKCDNGNQSTEMRGDVIGKTKIRPPGNVWQENQMARTRNRQEFRQSLQHRQGYELDQQYSATSVNFELQAPPIIAKLKPRER
jgi:hypothetical protein